MYIGPWQEYKLARLIELHNKQELSNQLQRQQQRPRQSTGRGAASRGGINDDSASVASSSRSGFSGISTQSAPPGAPGAREPSAQGRLNEFYNEWDRTRARPAGSDNSSRPDVPRPGSLRRPSSANQQKVPGRKSGSGRPAAKSRASAMSFEAQRRSRIQQMQKLYGLGAGDGEDQQQQQQDCTQGGAAAAAVPMSPARSVASGAAGRPPAMPTGVPPKPTRSPEPPDLSGPGADSGSGLTPDLDRALRGMRASIESHEQTPASMPVYGPPKMPNHLAPVGATMRSSPVLPVAPAPIPEEASAADPLNMSLGSSAGLIAWSKGLRPEDLSVSPEASLMSFYRPPCC
eukprot:gnl/TRDRNA2_/TRDRNA2_189564_c0_seq1.p1 gnl/TRDRNA2_/TRDRNA2_189564_c0~~gnl/TRDRNA2_/TRDRNA2_189564_c0_seq1.p1  ORF type:complete len:346 (+),score=62.41 gnl/TRDRNA2_/TRDRNA2_189564_c0_seq1:126-1163(+)